MYVLSMADIGGVVWLSWWRRDVSDEVTCQRGRLMDVPGVVCVALNLHIYTTLRLRLLRECLTIH